MMFYNVLYFREVIQHEFQENDSGDSFQEGRPQRIFVACGGSLTDLYNGYYFLQCESATIRSFWMNANEFLHATPKAFGDTSLVIVCSHSGGTAESVKAAQFAYDEGAAVITMTFKKGSKIDKDLPGYYSWIYDWGDDVPTREKPEGKVLELLNELLQQTDPNYALYDAMDESLTKMDDILKSAKDKVQNAAWLFAEAHHDTPMLYILGSGAAFSQAYAMAICSLMEMQWMHCCYLHSGEYFHGPFEVTDGKTPYVLMKSAGKTRALDERAEVFLKKYAGEGNTEVIDAMELGLEDLDPSVAEYFNCSLFYKMAGTYRDALDYTRRHPLSMRRYMGVVEY